MDLILKIGRQSGGNASSKHGFERVWELQAGATLSSPGEMGPFCYIVSFNESKGLLVFEYLTP